MKIDLRHLLSEPAHPSTIRARGLLESGAEVVDHQDAIAAAELLRIWLNRLDTVTLAGRKIVGLPDLLRALDRLPGDVPVYRAQITKGETSAIVFYIHEPLRLVGATLSPQRTKKQPGQPSSEAMWRARQPAA